VRQGIHQMPFCHLIALIINAHPSGTEIDSECFVYSINACLFGALPRFALLERGHDNEPKDRHRR
jgi:hypothetical protein